MRRHRRERSVWPLSSNKTFSAFKSQMSQHMWGLLLPVTTVCVVCLCSVSHSCTVSYFLHGFVCISLNTCTLFYQDKTAAPGLNVGPSSGYVQTEIMHSQVFVLITSFTPTRTVDATKRRTERERALKSSVKIISSHRRRPLDRNIPSHSFLSTSHSTNQEQLATSGDNG